MGKTYKVAGTKEDRVGDVMVTIQPTSGVNSSNTWHLYADSIVDEDETKLIPVEDLDWINPDNQANYSYGFNAKGEQDKNHVRVTFVEEHKQGWGPFKDTTIIKLYDVTGRDEFVPMGTMSLETYEAMVQAANDNLEQAGIAA